MNRREFVVAAASLAFAPRAFAESLGRGPIALVTADLESRVVAVDLSTAKVIRRVETLASPRGIETVGTKAVVTHWDVGAVSVVDGGTLSVKHVLHGFGAPRYIAGHPDGRHAYVTDANSGDVVVVDVLRGRVVGREHVGARARHIAIDRSGRTLWIALGARAASSRSSSSRSSSKFERRHRLRDAFDLDPQRARYCHGVAAGRAVRGRSQARVRTRRTAARRLDPRQRTHASCDERATALT